MRRPTQTIVVQYTFAYRARSAITWPRAVSGLWTMMSTIRPLNDERRANNTNEEHDLTREWTSGNWPSSWTLAVLKFRRNKMQESTTAIDLCDGRTGTADGELVTLYMYIYRDLSRCTYALEGRELHGHHRVTRSNRRRQLCTVCGEGLTAAVAVLRDDSIDEATIVTIGLHRLYCLGCMMMKPSIQCSVRYAYTHCRAYRHNGPSTESIVIGSLMYTCISI